MAIEKKKIVGTRLKDIEKWMMPEWDADGNLINEIKARPVKDDSPVKNKEPIEIEEPIIKYPTAAELEKIHSDAFQEGMLDGHKQGFEQGLEEGKLAGKGEGIAAGKVEGFEAGKETGIASGHALAEQELNQLRMTFAELLLQLDDKVKEEQVEWEKTIIGMVYQLSRSLILTELQKKPEIIQAIINKAIDALPDVRKRIRIQVNPTHFDLIKELADSVDGDWLVETDSSLAIGGCTVRTDQSLIDYSLDHRFRSQLATILEEAEIDPDKLIKEVEEPIIQPELEFQKPASDVERFESEPGETLLLDSIENNVSDPESSNFNSDQEEDNSGTIESLKSEIEPEIEPEASGGQFISTPESGSGNESGIAPHQDSLAETPTDESANT